MLRAVHSSYWLSVNGCCHWTPLCVSANERLSASRVILPPPPTVRSGHVYGDMGPLPRIFRAFHGEKNAFFRVVRVLAWRRDVHKPFTSLSACPGRQIMSLWGGETRNLLSKQERLLGDVSLLPVTSRLPNILTYFR